MYNNSLYSFDYLNINNHFTNMSYYLFDIIVAVKTNNFARAEALADIYLLEKFLSLIESGSLSQVKQMINEKLITDVNRGIIKACECGKIDILKYLLLLSDINPATQNNRALELACKYGHIEIIKYLLSLPKKSYVKRKSSLLTKHFNSEERIKQGLMKIIEVEDTYVIELTDDCLYTACLNNQLETVKFLTSYFNKETINEAITMATDPEVIKYLSEIVISEVKSKRTK